MEVIKASNISKDYKQGFFRKNSIHAVDNLSLTVNDGEVFGFLGPNGAGKTTFLKILLNICLPTTGSATLFGIDINSPRARREVGYLPENPYFYDRMNAYNLLEFYGTFYGMSRSRIKKRSDEVLEITGLNEAAKRPLRSYSKGMLQRIGLAQAILSEPRLVFLDEPSTGLDPMGRRKIKDVILDLKKNGVTVFLNSHILSDVQDTCDRIGIVNKGKLIRVADVHDLTVDLHILQIKMDNLDDNLLNSINTFVNSCKRTADNLIELALDSPSSTPDVIAKIVSLGGRIFEVKYLETSLEDMFISIIEKEGTN